MPRARRRSGGGSSGFSARVRREACARGGTAARARAAVVAAGSAREAVERAFGFAALDDAELARDAAIARDEVGVVRHHAGERDEHFAALVVGADRAGGI